MSLPIVCELQCGPFCGKQGVAVTRAPQYFFTNLLTRIMVEIRYGVRAPRTGARQWAGNLWIEHKAPPDRLGD
jgi:hypothetical protein